MTSSVTRLRCLGAFAFLCASIGIIGCSATDEGTSSPGRGGSKAGGTSGAGGTTGKGGAGGTTGGSGGVTTGGSGGFGRDRRKGRNGRCRSDWRHWRFGSDGWNAAAQRAVPAAQRGGGRGGATGGTGGATGGTGGATGGTGGATGGTGGATGGTGGATGGAGGTSGGGTGGVVDAGGPKDSGGGTGGGTSDASGVRFSFFVTSQAAMVALSGNAKGFGGDLRFGEADGLTGADKICTQTAERGMAGNGKTWRAFLSVTKGPGGAAVNAIDRIGNGPWYDRQGRLIAMSKADLVASPTQRRRPRYHQ